MKKWVVTALKVGRINMDRSSMTHFKNQGKREVFPIWAAAATNGNIKVIVDTGVGNLEEAQSREPGLMRNEEEILSNAIKSTVGWNPDEVDIVINTHLHFDHCGENKLFKNAKFYIQKKEYESAFNPIYSSRIFYSEEDFDKNAVSYFQWQFLNGDQEILPGLRIISTPGHTEGHQSVLFNTSIGTVCVSGDIVNIGENINENLEPNIVTNAKDVFESLKKIRRSSDYILPGHEISIKHGDTQFIKIDSQIEYKL